MIKIIKKILVNNQEYGNIIFISGIPGSGKTTIANKLSKKIENSVLINGDTIRDFVKNGYESPARLISETTNKSLSQYNISKDIQIYSAVLYAKQGYTVIVDDCLFNNYFEKYFKKKLKKLKYIKILIHPDLSQSQSQNSTRKCWNLRKEVLNETYKLMNSQNKDWSVINNTDMTVNETLNSALKIINNEKNS